VIKLRRVRWAGYAARGDERGAYRVLVGNPEGKRPLGRPGRRWEHLDFRNWDWWWWGGMGWINLAQERDMWLVVNAVMNLRDP
jgi:hypothetical protein